MLKKMSLTQESSCAVIFLHGYGANKEDLYPIGNFLNQRAGARKKDYIFFDAPEGSPFPGGRSWFSIDIQLYERAYLTQNYDLLTQRKTENMKKALELLRGEFLELKKHYTKIILGGFSQGSMLALEFALQNKELLNGLFLLSSTLMGYSWSKMPSDRGEQTFPVFQSHGKQDEVLRLTLAHQLKENLEKYFILDYHEFSGGHEIPPKIIQSLGVYLDQIS